MGQQDLRSCFGKEEDMGDSELQCWKAWLVGRWGHWWEQIGGWSWAGDSFRLPMETGKRQRTTVERLKRWKPWWISHRMQWSHESQKSWRHSSRWKSPSLWEWKNIFQGAYSCKRPCKAMHAAQMADVPGQWNSNWHFMAIDGKQFKIPYQGGVSEFSQCTHV